MPLGDAATVVALLGACLVALLLVLVARREAGALRHQAGRDVEAIRAEAQALRDDAERRQQRLAEREAAVTAERAEVERLERQARQRTESAAESQRAAERAVLAAERAAARTVDAAERTAAQRLAQAHADARAELESVAGLSQDEARDELARRVVQDATDSAAAQVRRVEAQARATAQAKARSIVATATQRLAVPTSAELAVSLLALPGEEMKGRIIGKEGRNIRAFEALTGVNVLVDDSPEHVTLSSFDPERREVARLTLEALVADGRITPARIESTYAQVVASQEERTDAAGHDAAQRAGVRGLDPEVVHTLGGLRLRTSYGQNVLEHLVEVALLAATVAAELGADVEVARRAGLLHDLGKALTATMPGTHARLGADLLKRCGESAAVVHAVEAHHDEVPPGSVEAVIVQVADAISAARPGARHSEVEQYLERMETLEALVAAHPGVQRALAMSAGHEVRVVVEPDLVDDDALPALAQAIAAHVEAELAYPGEIKVTVVRELRATATAG